MITYQLSENGTNRYRVQLFDADGLVLEDRDIVKEVNGWRVLDGSRHDTPQHQSPQDAARWFATVTATARNG